MGTPRISPVRRGRAGLFAIALATCSAWVPLVGASEAAAEARAEALGIPCVAEDGVQRCNGALATRVPSFDGVPLDLNVTLPGPEVEPPYPLLVFLHGFGGNKGGEQDPVPWAQSGYAVLNTSARGFGDSCGTPGSRLADPEGCAEGWIHAADFRYEARDVQTLAGMLADEGIAKPRRIGVSGTSYGGVQSFLLAALRDRVMLEDGSLVPWRSESGKPMRIAAAAPRWGWSQFTAALAPNGRSLDFLKRNPYGKRVGVPELSYFNFLVPVGATGYYAPPGADPGSDIYTWYERFSVEGEPFDHDPYVRSVIEEANRNHSAYYLEQGRTPRGQRRKPAPIFAYNAWSDDLNPVDEVVRYFNQIRARFRRPNELSALFAAGSGHPRASLTAPTPDFDDFRERFFARYLMAAKGRRIGVRTYTQPCNGSRRRGPFVTRTWRRQHPGEVRFRDGRSVESFDGTGGNPGTASALDPFASTGNAGCVTIPAGDDPNTAVYRGRPAEGDGYTMVGAPTVVAWLSTDDPFAQVQARLWDVGPDGSQTFVTRTAYRPRLGEDRKQVFQLQPNAWHFAEGHVPKLELLGRDGPYARPSNGTFSVDVGRLRLRLPVREQPGTAPGVRKPRRAVLGNGRPAKPRQLAR